MLRSYENVSIITVYALLAYIRITLSRRFAPSRHNISFIIFPFHNEGNINYFTSSLIIASKKSSLPSKNELAFKVTSLSG